ncbi:MULTISPECIES: antitoxin [Corynebacterium]|uniref:antitoxin n=1 Tax=Corynebacterium TaxID=1716 RepID=UPI00124DFF23|nr:MULTISPECIES: antitoxin [Corynebacterium]MBV7281121.1 antitoxin [Corynebacterium sp. TAE3-ERU30]MBV7301692.1 antitoxin [Corynebacterium sp. TAE3-ERU2]
MGIMDKAKEFLSDDDKRKDVLDKGEQVAKDKLGNEHSDKVDKARDAIDKKFEGSTEGEN